MLDYLKENFHNYVNLKEYFLSKVNDESTLKALEFAETKHSSQTRFNKTPYIIHPLRVALVLVEELKIRNVNLINAALLHDVVEDTNTALSEIESKFGFKTANYVKLMTKYKDMSAKEYITLISRNKDAIVLKLSDILDNLRSIKYEKNSRIPDHKYSRMINKYLFYTKKLSHSFDPVVVDLVEKIRKLGIFPRKRVFSFKFVFERWRKTKRGKVKKPFELKFKS